MGLVHRGVDGRREGDANPEGRDGERDLEEMEILPRDLEQATNEGFDAEDDREDDRPDHGEHGHRVADDGRDIITWSTVGALSDHLHHGDADAQIEQV